MNKVVANHIRPLNILLVLHSHNCGGAEKHLIYLAEGLSAQGFKVHVACPADSWLAEQVCALGLNHIHLGMHGFLDFWSLTQLVRYIRKHSINLLHGHLMRGAHYAAWAGRLCHVPVLATAHSTNTWKHLRRHPRIIAVSHAVRDSLLARNFPPEQIVVIENGIPVPVVVTPEERRLIRHDLGIAENEFALVNVARFVRDKGQDVLVRALRQAIDAGALTLRLFLVGETSGAWYKEIRTLVSELDLGDRVVFLGHREDVARVLAAMDLFVLPSRREALSLAILEAFAAKVPVIASATGGIPELVRDGQTGYLCTIENDGQLSELILELASDAEKSRQMTDQALKVFLENFTSTAMTSRIAGLYSELIALSAIPERRL